MARKASASHLKRIDLARRRLSKSSSSFAASKMTRSQKSEAIRKYKASRSARSKVEKRNTTPVKTKETPVKKNTTTTTPSSVNTSSSQQNTSSSTQKTTPSVGGKTKFGSTSKYSPKGKVTSSSSGGSEAPASSPVTHKVTTTRKMKMPSKLGIAYAKAHKLITRGTGNTKSKSRLFGEKHRGGIVGAAVGGAKVAKKYGVDPLVSTGRYLGKNVAYPIDTAYRKGEKEGREITRKVVTAGPKLLHKVGRASANVLHPAYQEYKKLKKKKKEYTRGLLFGK